MIPLEWLYDRFTHEETISKEQILEQFGIDQSEQVILTLNYLITQGIVIQSQVRGKHVFMISNIGSLNKLKDDAMISTKSSQGVNSEFLSFSSSANGTEILVVSAPVSMLGRLQSLRIKYKELEIEEMMIAFKKLLSSAQIEVLLSVPFLELDGLMVFVNEIKELGKRKVSIKALTRELILPNKFDFGYYQKLRAFSKLIDLYVSGGGDPKNIEIRDYTIKIGRNSEMDLTYEGIHQKMIIIDRTKAYIGSGEIRAPSFVVNGDVGVLQQGKAAEFWTDYFMLFWSEARNMELDFFASLKS